MSKGVCLICGRAKTVKTHLFPRALILDMRGDAKAVYSGSRHRDGHVEKQNGQWDDRFLCEEHEAKFAQADDYGVRICRQIADVPAAPIGPKTIGLDNPRPDLFARFVYACVWRHVMAPVNAHLGLNLGRYEAVLRRALFEDQPADLQILASVSGISGADGPVSFGLEPYRQKFHGLNTWHFIVGRLDVQLKTDARAFPASWAELLADQNPLTLIVEDAADIATVPLLRPITDRIRANAARRR